MSVELHSFAENRIAKEEVIAGRLAVKLVKFIPGYGDLQQRTVKLYGYVRALEDRVDNGTRPRYALGLTENELNNTQQMLEGNDINVPDDFPYSNLVPMALAGLPNSQRQAVLLSMQEIVQGINLDSHSIIAGQPLPGPQQDQRHLYASMSGFQVVSDLIYNRDLNGKDNPDVDKLFRTWIIYDALVDLRDDLSAGLVLFRQADLDRHGIQLSKGEEVPPEFEDLFKKIKPEIARDLVKNAKNILLTDLPKPFSYLLWGYFRSFFSTINLPRCNGLPIVYNHQISQNV
jgi:hypothetical protein